MIKKNATLISCKIYSLLWIGFDSIGLIILLINFGRNFKFQKFCVK